MLQLDELYVSFYDFQILTDVSLTVEGGQIVTIVGSNGAGKSTLLAAISGLLHPTSGRIQFLGKEIKGLPPSEIVEMGLIHVPEGRHLFPDLTVMDNLELGAYAARARMKRRETLGWVLDLFPLLRERRRQLARTLSGGEQQMLAIGRALMLRPVLIMLDEPSLGLAPMLVLHLFEIVKKINDQGIGVLLVEQNVQHALALAHKGYVLETGRIVLEDEGPKLLDNEDVKKAYLGL